MYVKDYMSQDLVTVTPETSVLKAVDVLKAHDINRLPVMVKGKLVGLVTKEEIDLNSPTNASSLSKYEMNYLLDKMTVGDIMAKHMFTVSPDTLLDEAAETMLNKSIGSLLVMEGEKLVGIITDKDIFRTFIDISGYYTAGTSLVIELSDDRKGVIEEIGDALVAADHNLSNMLVYHLRDAIRVVLHVDEENVDNLIDALSQAGYEVKTVVKR
ncbi:CBS domain-containing protein [Eremococcus coleocola]|uniref:CBS domain protein n=1 Tax=Eremococcus coleocola ACS-139-V-Col8 TaxID=908337 RepID=E4KQF0_9LACT|nr:CBS domain-containing protein [Eremococcus coleocola]EFR30688.1 CBS domain protein [Eremococcus coleocola ACS-139-V-Col8]